MPASISAPHHRRTFTALAMAAVICVVASAAEGGILAGQVDTFQDGTTMGWSHGPISPNPPTNIPTGGPAGAGDAYLQNVSTGFGGAGGRHVMFNESQWVGDYTGLSFITMDVANFGTNDLFLRIVVAGPAGGYASSTPFHLPAGSGWQQASFGLSAADMSLVLGTGTLQDTLADVTQMRILSAAAGPSFIGDVVAATLGVDNIRAIPEPSATTALAGMALLGLRRRR